MNPGTTTRRAAVYRDRAYSQPLAGIGLPVVGRKAFHTQAAAVGELLPAEKVSVADQLKRELVIACVGEYAPQAADPLTEQGFRQVHQVYEQDVAGTLAELGRTNPVVVIITSPAATKRGTDHTTLIDLIRRIKKTHPNAMIMFFTCSNESDAKLGNAGQHVDKVVRNRPTMPCLVVSSLRELDPENLSFLPAGVIMDDQQAGPGIEMACATASADKIKEQHVKQHTHVIIIGDLAEQASQRFADVGYKHVVSFYERQWIDYRSTLSIESRKSEPLHLIIITGPKIDYGNVNFPVVNRFLQELRARFPDTPFMYFTGSAEQETHLEPATVDAINSAGGVIINAKLREEILELPLQALRFLAARGDMFPAIESQPENPASRLG